MLRGRRTDAISGAGASCAVAASVLLCGYAANAGCGRVDTIVGAAVGPSEPADAACAPASFYLDLAAAALGGGFAIEADPDAPGGTVLVPPAVSSESAPGDASATYAFDVACAHDYLLWGRIRGPAVNENSFWFSIDDGGFYQWRLSTGVIWYWKAATSGAAYVIPLHFALDAGAHRLVFRNSSPDVSLAGIYVAPPGEVPPGNDTPCDPPNSIQLEDGGCEMSCGASGGNQCEVMTCVGRPTFTVYDCAVCCYVAAEAGALDAGDDADD